MNASQWDRGYPKNVGRSVFFARLEPLLSSRELFLVETAYNLSKYGHRGQWRDDGTRYFDHPKSVAWILIEELRIINAHTIALALLHDIQEDSYIVTWELLGLIFGEDFVYDLKLLTRNGEQKEEYVERLSEFGTSDALLVKLADRMHNLMTLSACTIEKRRKQVKETRGKYFSLTDALERKLPESERWMADYFRIAMNKYCKENDV